jgi:hypothetical protein
MLEIKPVTVMEPIKEIRKIKKEDARPANRQIAKKKPELKDEDPGKPTTYIDELA